jgi:hypothetical protein
LVILIDPVVHDQIVEWEQKVQQVYGGGAEQKFLVWWILRRICVVLEEFLLIDLPVNDFFCIFQEFSS